MGTLGGTSSIPNPMLSCFAGSVHRHEGRPISLAKVCAGNVPHESWYQMDLVIVAHCDGLLRLPGESVGADLEVAEARRLSLPVFFSVDEVVNWKGWKK